MKEILSEVVAECAIYWRESARPLASLLHIAPLLLAYEVAAVVPPTLPHSAAESWLQTIVQSISFRMTAGVLFSVLYLTRGLGITVGAHVTYDMFVALACNA